VAPLPNPRAGRLWPTWELPASPASAEAEPQQEKVAKAGGTSDKEEVGRATWMLLRTIATQVLDLLPLYC